MREYDDERPLIDPRLKQTATQRQLKAESASVIKATETSATQKPINKNFYLPNEGPKNYSAETNVSKSLNYLYILHQTVRARDETFLNSFQVNICPTYKLLSILTAISIVDVLMFTICLCKGGISD